MKNGGRLPQGMRCKGKVIEHRFYLPKIGGGTVRVSVTGRTRTECRHKADKIRRQGAVAADDIKLNELLDRYLERREKQRKNERTSTYVAGAFERHVRPYIGTYSLSTLCAHWQLIGDVFEELAGKRGACALQKTFDELNRAFKYAMKKSWAPSNPCTLVSRPKYHAPEVRPLTVAEITQLMKLADEQTRLVVVLLATSAMRPQDLWPLRPCDINREQGGIYLERFVSRDSTGRMHIVERGKSKRSRRFVPLLEQAIQLIDHYVTVNSLAADELLLADCNGGLMRDNNFGRRTWKPLVSSIGRSDCTLKTLRHSANSFMAELGVPVDVRAAILGNGAAVNLRTYTHISDNAKRLAVGQLEHLFSGAISTVFHPATALTGENRGNLSPTGKTSAA